ncbi:L-threonine 3-dehydrogenase [Calothrix sp. NIES-4071]|nr:L-threonine 3-dehydrogenase [Calothrix sp. NIES-4071]BAZ54940.1 L-threonine 3-dehydrogenase [Calothrix sp. NIES-4105]
MIKQPQILGDEIIGVVEEVGHQVEDLHVGDRIVLDQGLNYISNLYQPLCEYCASSDSHQSKKQCKHMLNITSVQKNI